MSKTGDGILAGNANWTFSGEAVTNFETHVEKSVPLRPIAAGRAGLPALVGGNGDLFVAIDQHNLADESGSASEHLRIDLNDVFAPQ